MLDARLVQLCIATAFTLEIRIVIYQIILFGDLQWMALS